MNMNDRKAIAKPMIYAAIIMVLSSCLVTANQTQPFHRTEKDAKI